ncbi:MAG: DNA-3-methyladenine glycosylase family protein [Cellulosilyticaceae bacterium]
MKNAVMIQHINHFDIGQILESGQVFRFEKISDLSYLLIAKQKLIKVTQQIGSSSVVIHNAHSGELEEIWKYYFDLETDYEKIVRELSNKDEYMRQAIAFGPGIRILKQDPWEMLISFIISQNKAIPHIKQCIKNITEKYGEALGEEDRDEHIYYTFPTPEQLAKVTEEELRECKVGFRAPYIIDACEKVSSGEIVLSDIYSMSTEDGKKELMKIKGVGPKIADCILLFAFGKTEVFPTDVWIKRVIEGIYFEGKDMKLEQIQQFAKDYFGDLAGYAQQYLFFYGRENALFKEAKVKKKKEA